MNPTMTDAPEVSAATRRAGVSVELEGVVKDYRGGRRALQGVDLRLEPGELVALLGPSGCGKTTALRALAGLDGITAGDIRIDGASVVGVPVHRRDIGMVFQSYSLFPHLTALENVEYGLRTRGVPAARRRAAAMEQLEMVGLGDRGRHYAHELSGGQQQRVALARALVTRPRVLLLDEPLSALDAKVRVQLREEIRRIQLELGITTVFVTHDQEEALAVADRVAVMHGGRIEQFDAPERLYREPASRFVADFVGVSNRLQAQRSGERLLVHGVAVTVRQPLPEGASLLAYLRPEQLTLRAPSEADVLHGEVVATSFLGAIRRTRVLLEDGTPLLVQHPSAEVPAIGERVGVALGVEPVTVLAAH